MTGVLMLAACQHPGAQRNDAASASAQPTAPGAQSTQAAASQSANSQAPAVTFHLAQARPAQGLAQVEINPQVALYAVPQPVFTQADLQRVVTTQNNAGQAFLRFDFNEKGAAKLATLASQAAGNYLLVSVRGTLIAAPQIASAYPNGQFPVSVSSVNAARDILATLR